MTDTRCLDKLDNPNLVKELNKWKGVDIRLEKSSKHNKLFCIVNGKSKFVLLSKTPSDWRGKLRQVSDVRKTLIELGAEKM